MDKKGPQSIATEGKGYRLSPATLIGLWIIHGEPSWKCQDKCSHLVGCRVLTKVKRVIVDMPLLAASQALNGRRQTAKFNYRYPGI